MVEEAKFEEVKIEQYMGVVCRSCRQPIALPHSVAAACANDTRAEMTVFTLRCRACDRERPYRRGDVRTFDGAPRPRPMPFAARRAQHDLARAANG